MSAPNDSTRPDLGKNEQRLLNKRTAVEVHVKRLAQDLQFTYSKMTDTQFRKEVTDALIAIGSLLKELR